MTLAVSRQPFTLETQVRSQARLGEACDRLSKAGTRFSQCNCTSVCCCQRHASTLLSSEGQAKGCWGTFKKHCSLANREEWTQMSFTCYDTNVWQYLLQLYSVFSVSTDVSWSYPRDHPSSKLLHMDGRTDTQLQCPNQACVILATQPSQVVELNE
jgi:hypothetical protein